MAAAPDRPKAEYWILTLVAVLALGLGLGVAVAKYVATSPSGSPSPSVSARPHASISPVASSSPDATAGWTAYSDATDKFSLRYPAAWPHRTCLVGAHTTLYLAPTADTLGVCNSGFGGQMHVGAMDGDQRASLKWTAGYTDLVTTSITVAGVTGIRQTASAGTGPDPRDQLAQYLFFTAGRTYTAAYTQKPSAPDTLSDFDLMVKTTLVFTP